MPWKVSKWFHQKVRSTDGLENICCMIFLHMIHLGNGLGAFLTSTGAKWAHRDPAWLSRWRLSTPKLFPTSPESLKKLWRVIINWVNEHTWPFGIWKCVKACMCVFIYIYRLLVSVSVWQSPYWFWAWRVGDGGLNLDRKLSIQLKAARHHAHQFLKGSPLKHVRMEFQRMSNFRAETDIAVPCYSKCWKCLTPCGTQKHASPDVSASGS